MLTSLLLLTLSLTSASTEHSVDNQEAAPSQTYQAKEHYRFNLGGHSGMYTDWERTDLDGFDGLTTTISIDKTYGEPTDRWASLARINLFGPGEGEARPQLSFMFIADRKDGHVDATIMRARDKPRERFDVKLAVGKAFTMNIMPQGAGKLLIVIDKAKFEVPADFEVKGLGVVGSGIDVKFEPFNLLKRAAQ